MTDQSSENTINVTTVFIIVIVVSLSFMAIGFSAGRQYERSNIENEKTKNTTHFKN